MSWTSLGLISSKLLERAYLSAGHRTFLSKLRIDIHHQGIVLIFNDREDTCNLGFLIIRRMQV